MDQEASQEVDVLMEEAAGMRPPDKEDMMNSSIARHHEPKKTGLSKKQRARLKTLDKL